MPLGPVPETGVSADAARGLTAPQASMLSWLRETGADQTVATAATARGLHRNTVREHLDRLVEAGLVVRSTTPTARRGRPAWRYRARPDAGATELRAYAGLTRMLARQLQRSAADPGAQAEEIGREWGRELAQNAAAAARNDTAVAAQDDSAVVAQGSGAREQILAQLAELGFGPVDAGGCGASEGPVTAVALTRCPLLQAARECPEVICRVHLGLIRGALDSFGGAELTPVLTPFAQPGSCTLHLNEPAS
ncbi:hypothetical protein GOHSU_16_00750 [Gordonia hirsuta DSM 44140 = NBRC 16056]|uniref:HTH marR-type domain-containing protein n=1 Tax=Gordonia hirsuta DSM 44140 = NBRC 16056 TaxID=1121927 RepID=L7LAR3_9ACTN|nr:hypothetical protein GOHSU_16_00750 [Gordonia hirsuta DSM 44140 = NBRC 16056]